MALNGRWRRHPLPMNQMWWRKLLWAVLQCLVRYSKTMEEIKKNADDKPSGWHYRFWNHTFAAERVPSYNNGRHIMLQQRLMKQSAGLCVRCSRAWTVRQRKKSTRKSWKNSRRRTTQQMENRLWAGQGEKAVGSPAAWDRENPVGGKPLFERIGAIFRVLLRKNRPSLLNHVLTECAVQRIPEPWIVTHNIQNFTKLKKVLAKATKTW